VQLDQIQSLASQTPASGPARLKVLQAAAGQAITANEFRPILASDEKIAAESNQVQLLSQQVARLEKVLQEVIEYKQLVNAPQRATATPTAARMATFAQDLLAVSFLHVFMSKLKVQLAVCSSIGCILLPEDFEVCVYVWLAYSHVFAELPITCHHHKVFAIVDAPGLVSSGHTPDMPDGVCQQLYTLQSIASQ